jgi:hypothetical protein
MPAIGWRLKQHGADLPPLFSEFAGNEAKNLHLAGVPSVKRAALGLHRLQHRV